LEAIYVVGYPRSGCTWLTRLVSSSLGLAAGGAHPFLDASEPATQDGDSPIVRKGHYELIRKARDFKEMETPVPEPEHKMYWRVLTDEPVFYIVRDPRDIAVSGAHYWPKFTVSQFLHYMAYKRPWWRHVSLWLNVPYPVEVIRYEDLLDHTCGTLLGAFKRNGLDCDVNRIREAVEHWDFNTHIDRGASRRMLRKGISGDWRNYFDGDMEKQAERYFGSLMEYLGYD